MTHRERQFRTPAIILKRFDLGEADRLLTLLTPRHGKIEVIAKGVRNDRQLEQHERGEKRDDEPGRGLPDRYRAAVLAKRPSDREQCEDAERRLQLQHKSPNVHHYDRAT